jgi:hypothetical protein
MPLQCLVGRRTKTNQIYCSFYDIKLKVCFHLNPRELQTLLPNIDIISARVNNHEEMTLCLSRRTMLRVEKLDKNKMNCRFLSTRKHPIHDIICTSAHKQSTHNVSFPISGSRWRKLEPFLKENRIMMEKT